MEPDTDVTMDVWLRTCAYSFKLSPDVYNNAKNPGILGGSGSDVNSGIQTYYRYNNYVYCYEPLRKFMLKFYVSTRFKFRVDFV